MGCQVCGLEGLFLARFNKRKKRKKDMIKIIAVTYGHDKEVDVFLNSLILQTSDEWELWLVHDGIPPKSLRDKMVKFNHDRRIHFDWSSQRVGAWGHANRGKVVKENQGNR